MQKLLQGVLRFQDEVYPKQRALFQSLAGRQQPSALFLTCADSRIHPSLLTQTQPGELFICRNAGNIAPPFGGVGGGVAATIEYAVMVLNVRAIVVCGHSDCGAMKAVLQPEKLRDVPQVAAWLNNSEAARMVVRENHPGLAGEDLLTALTEENVLCQIANLRTHPCVAARERKGELALSAWFYDIGAGHVRVHDEAAGAFVPVEKLVDRSRAAGQTVHGTAAGNDGRLYADGN